MVQQTDAPPPTRAKGSPLAILTSLVVITLIAIVGYLVARTFLVLTSSSHWGDFLSAGVLLCAETFIVLHGVGYFLNLLHVIRRKDTGLTRPVNHPFTPKRADSHLEKAHLDYHPAVAIIVASYKEPVDILEDTLTCFANLRYPYKQLFLLDDTRYDRFPAGESPEEYRNAVDKVAANYGAAVFRRSWRGAKAGIINDFVNFLGGEARKEFSLTPPPEAAPQREPEYLIVFDADMNPFPDFVEPLVAALESDPRLAFIQTPQYYTNFEYNRVARASGLQQAVFYEFICEGKSLQNAMFCCGTNVMFRIAALKDVGGLREDSVTEDFATSFIFHTRGWRSLYLNRPSAFGLGPEDLGAFFKQQYRWALGTVGLLRPVVKHFCCSPRTLPAAVWWEYFLSTTHYFVGWAFLIMALCPVLFLFFDLPTYYVRPDFYVLFYTPYAVLTLILFFWTLKKRSYSFADLFMGMILLPVSFPIYIRASTRAILGLNGSFQVTPKKGIEPLSLVRLWPQVTLACACFGATVFGAFRLYYENDNLLAIVMNMFWCLYFTLLLTGVLYFNFPQEAVASPEESPTRTL